MQQIFDFKWEYIQQNNKYYRILSLRNTESNEIANVPLDAFQFNFSLSKNKYCAGFFSKGKYIECKNKIRNGTDYELEGKNDSLCYSCEQEQGFKSEFFFGQTPNENIKEHLAQKHFIYLAYFYPDIIKVGTAAESRKFIRPIEQDALLYAYIAESTGFEIQKLERSISQALNITLSVRSSQKLKFLDNKPNHEDAIKILQAIINSALDKFKNSEFKNNFLNQSQIKIINNIPNLFFPNKEVNLINIAQFSDEVPVVGTFKGLRGNYLLIENHDNILAFDCRSLIGRFVDYQEDYIYAIEPRLF